MEISLPVAFIRMLSEPAFFNRATPFVRRIEDFETYFNQMIFERSRWSCFSRKPFRHAFCEMVADEIDGTFSKTPEFYGAVYETTDRIAAAGSYKSGSGKNAGG